MKTNLVELGMRLEKVPGDGNCGPHAAASFLAALSPELSRGIPSIGNRRDRGMGVRRAVKHYVTRADFPHQRRLRLFEGDLWQRKDKPSKSDMMLSIKNWADTICQAGKHVDDLFFRVFCDMIKADLVIHVLVKDNANKNLSVLPSAIVFNRHDIHQNTGLKYEAGRVIRVAHTTTELTNTGHWDLVIPIPPQNNGAGAES
jgi:hypothetical protein